jgi:hypothetical protein
MKLKMLGAALAAMLLGASSANAATYIVNFTGTGATTAQFNVTTADTLNAVNGYDILALSGNVNGDAVTGLLANPNQPGVTNNGVWLYDNVLFPAADPFIDYYSFVGTLASGGTANLFVNNPADYELMVSPPGGGYSLDSHGVATLAVAVPEPASWAIMMTGLFGMGLALRSRRKSQTSATLA